MGLMYEWWSCQSIMTYVPCKYMQEIKLQVLITKNLIHYQTISNTNMYMKSFCTLTKIPFIHQLQSQKWLKNIKAPIHQKPRAVKGKFQFVPPTEILTTGSFVTGTCIKPNITVDLVVVIPQVNVLYNYFYSHLCVHMEDLNFFYYI